jgi:PKD repeat protein
MVTADALPTTQINGVAWSQVIVGNTVYVGGSFTSARPAGSPLGTNESPRSNFLAYNLTTGALDTTFAPAFNQQVKTLAVSPDQKTLYVGGDFTTADGKSRSRVAAYDLSTGTLISTFRPVMASSVNAIVATDSTVYLGGTFKTVNGIDRHYVAAVQAGSGALTTWDPNADSTVNAMVLTPDGSRLILGGSFSTVSGGTNLGLAAVDSTTGAVLPWAANQTIHDYSVNSSIDTLTTDGTNVYGGGFNYGTDLGNLEGVFSAEANSGTLNWVASCHGDTYGTYPDAAAGVVYVVSHEHQCSDLGGFGQTDLPWTTHRTSAFTLNATGTAQHNYLGGHYQDYYGTPSPSIVGDWLPDYLTGSYTGKGQAAWTITGNGQYVVEGGEFPAVNGTAQQGLTRFAVSSLSTNKQGPRVNGANFVPNVSAAGDTTARVTFDSNWDRDDDQLTYQVLRDGTQVYTTTAKSIYWNRPMLGFTDTGLTPGQTYTYAVNALDDDGNVAHGASVTYTQPLTAPPGQTSYAAQVITDGAGPYWPLTEASGTTFFADGAGFNDALETGTTSSDASGPIAGTTATAFDGSTGAGYQEATSAFGPNTFSLEAWFKTTSTAGGEIAGFGSAPTGLSQTNDRVVYLNSTGNLVFGVTPTISSGTAPKRTVVTPASYDDGAWHQVVATLSGSGMALYVDGALTGTLASTTSAQSNYPGYWRIGGDNLAGWTGAPSSNYLAGSIAQVAVYPAALSASAISNHYSLRTGGTTNSPPTASFTATPTDLSVAFDGSASSDTDGTIASYAWDFGDGSPVDTTTGATPTHPYAAAGTYTVTLAVTDNGGATGSISQPVTVTSAGGGGTPTTYAADAFGRTLSGGWGSADTGGSWTVSSAPSFSVAAGAGAIAQAANASPSAYLNGLAGLTDTDSTVDVAIDKIPTGSSGSDYLYLAARRVGTSEYELRARVLSSGSVQVQLIKQTSGTAKGLAGAVTLPGTYTAGTVLHLRLDVAGSSSVTLQGKVWTGSTEPTAWTTTATDATTPFASGVPGVKGYLLGATNAPITATWDNLLVQSIGSGAGGGTVGPPTAAFSSTHTDLTASFDASGSAAGAGSTIQSYSWDFGDSTAAGSGVSPTHPYAAAGTYTVTLTVTDADSQTDTVSHAITVTDPGGAGTVLAADQFNRTVSGGWGTAGTGGAWAVSGGASAFSVSSNSGAVSTASGAHPAAALSGLSLTDTDSTVDVSINKVPTGSGASDYLYLGARRTGTSEYELRARVRTGGSVQLSLIKQTSGVASGLQTVTVSGLTYTASTVLHLRLQVSGSASVSLKGKVWTGSTEPTAWTVSATNASSPFTSGAPSLSAYLLSASNGPIVARFDNLSVVSL